MKVLTLITGNNTKTNQWQFDRVLTLLAYDMDITIVFMNSSHQQLSDFKAWNSLTAYGVDQFYLFQNSTVKLLDTHQNYKEINALQLKKMISNTEFIL